MRIRTQLIRLRIRSHFRFWSTFAFLLLALIFMSSCQFLTITRSALEHNSSSKESFSENKDVLGVNSKSPVPSETPKPYIKTARLVAVGDVMMHQPQITNAFNAKTKTYDMTSYFSEVRNILTQGDWVVANLETTLAGADAGGYSGYPQFNSPVELADALKYAGFNVITTANNHSLDRRELGVIRTLKHLRERGFETTGTADSLENANSKLILTKQDIKMGFLAYTYGTNGIPIPANKDYLVNLIDINRMIADIKQIRKLGADLVVVSMHYGNEYQRMPSEQQIEWSTALIKAGADIILGSHPHVVQPMQWVEVKQSDGSVHKGLILYSMGNFISSQVRDYKDIGIIAQIEVSKSFPQGIAQVDRVDFIPTYVNREVKQGKSHLTILPLDSQLNRFESLLASSTKLELMTKYRDEIYTHMKKLEPIHLNESSP